MISVPRLAPRVSLVLVAWLSTLSSAAPGAEFRSHWPASGVRMWVGPSCWANRLHDWRVAHGRLECVAGPKMGLRTVHLLTHRVAPGGRAFEASVVTGLLDPAEGVAGDAATGLLVGVGGHGMDARAAVVIHGRPGRGAGIFAGVDAAGRVSLVDLEADGAWPLAGSRPASPATIRGEEIRLVLRAAPAEDGRQALELTARDAEGRELGSAALEVDQARAAGGVALVSHPGRAVQGRAEGRFWFREWGLGGDAVEAHADRSLGPILSTMYTLSRSTLKMTAQLFPIGPDDPDSVRLEIRRGDDWLDVARARIVRPGYTATLRVESWDSSRDVPFRVVYEMETRPGLTRVYSREGVVRRDPVDRETIVVAGFTGNHNCAHAVGVRRGAVLKPADWVRGMWFPHADLTARVAVHRPDVLFFSGDQVYEGDSPSFADRSDLHHDYLYKWYLWCWAWRDLTADRPALAIPDDHDVYQGNLWGESGRATPKDDRGGYVHPADFVKMVERTQASHFPDPWDPRPIDQGIGVYFTDMVYGGVGFAVLEDRKFKSGCAGRVAGKRRGRADHINDPDFDMSRADQPGLKLLGDRQLAFLRHFAGDWSGQEMKIALSQTVFAGMATHHGGNLFRLIADLDSNGWPQSARNRALAELRRGFVFHLAGDQHLASLVHHGIDAHDDAIWSFAVPSVANFYPRAWVPEAEGTHRPPGFPPHLGRHHDGLRNRVTVWGVTNPTSMTKVSTGRFPPELHDAMPGYGIVRLNKRTRDYVVECWPRYADPGRDAQYEGWPKRIPQRDNYARTPVGHLAAIECRGMLDPVVRVIDEASGELVYALRIRGVRFRPPVYRTGPHTVEVGEPQTSRWRQLRGLQPAGEGETVLVEF